MKWKRSEKVGLKLNIEKMKIMASGPIASLQINGETMKTVTDLIFLGSKITADGGFSYEIKWCLFFRRKAMIHLHSVNRDITLLTKSVWPKLWFFPVVMFECESWTIKKAECQRIKLLNSGVGERSLESLGLQGDQTSQS